jgi:hypothetical protein
MSCSSQNEGTVHKKIIDFNVTNKIELVSDSLFPDMFTAFYGILANDSTGFSLVAPNLKLLLKYDFDGNLIQTSAGKALKDDFKVPSGYFPSHFCKHRDTLYLLYPDKNIYVIQNNEVLNKIQLQIPQNTIITCGSPFFYDSIRNIFVLSFGQDYEKSKDFFSKNQPISFFDAQTGKLIKSFGKYPDAYKQGHSFQGGLNYIRSLRESTHFYIMYPHFSQVYQYDFDGNLSNTFNLPESNERDITFKFSEKEIDKLNEGELRKLKNDAYIGGFAKEKDNNVFYYSFYAHKSSKIYICKYDADKELFTQTALPKIASFIHLFPHVFDGKLYFFSINSQSDDLYIYETFLD